MRVPVDYCQILGSKGANNFKFAFNKRKTLAKPLIGSILTAFLLVVGLAEAMGDSHATSHKDNGAIRRVIVTPIPESTTTTAPAPTTVVLLGIGLVGLAGADIRRRRKVKTVDRS